jgi:(p)ppGpp synthase/HD superfamily hydrolase
MKPRATLGPDFVRAVEFAGRIHAGDARKGTDIPYVSHLLAVAALTLEHGGGELHAIAALLHDTIEDHPREASFERLSREFGSRVAEIVRACSDTEAELKEGWCFRKTRYVEHLLRNPDPDALIVSFADKLHNARSILADVRRDGVKSLDRFSGRQRGTLWYYRALVEAFRTLNVHVAELDEAVSELESIVGDRVEGPCPDL